MAGEINWGILNTQAPTQAVAAVQAGQDQGRQNVLQALLMREAVRKQADQDDIRAAVQEAGDDPNLLRDRLLKGAHFAEASAMAKYGLDQRKAEAEIGKTQAQTLASQQETHAKQVDMLARAGGYLAQAGNATPENERAALDWLHNSGAIPDDAYQKGLAMNQADPSPEGIARRAALAQRAGLPVDKQLPQVSWQDQGSQRTQVLTDPLTGQAAPGAVLPIGQSPDNAATQATALAGQQSRAQQAQAALRQGRTPAGYQAAASGGLEPVPGGPADYKQQLAAAQAYGANTEAVTSLDDLAKQAQTVLNHPGLPGILGIKGMLPNIPGGSAANAQAELDTLLSKSGIGTLQMMRNASKTGGAVGQVTEKEWPILQGYLTAISRSQDETQFKANLQKLSDWAEGAKQRMGDVYALNPRAVVPGASPQAAPAAPTGGSTAGPVQVRNPQEAAALPIGTAFITPDGQHRVRR